MAELLGLFEASRAAALRLFLKDKTAIQSLRRRSNVMPLHIRPATTDWEVFTQVYVRQDYAAPSQAHEKRLRDYCDRIVAEGRVPCIIDCGANIGLSTRWFAEQYPSAIVIGIEPEPSNFRLLQMNTMSLAGVVAIEAAVSSRSDPVSLKTGDGGAGWSWQTTRDADGAIKARTIEDVLASVPNAAPFIAKIDIEGFEVDLFQANTSWIDLFPLVVFESHDWLFPWSGSAHSFLSSLVRRKRDYLQKDENTFAYLHELPDCKSTMQTAQTQPA